MTLLSSPVPRERLLRAKDIHAPDGRLPISRSKFFELVREGTIARPLKLSARISAWRESDIAAFIAKAEEGHYD